MVNQPVNFINKFLNRFKYRAALSQRHTKHFLIPYEGNSHKPHALRPKALKIYASSLILIKLFITGFLFLSYPSTASFAAITTAEILNLTNASRQEAGVGALALNSQLNQAAMLKAQDMLADNYFAHIAPDGTKPWAFIQEVGYSYSAAGENLAMDFTEAESVQAAFMNSPSHKKNILNPKYKEMGIAVVTGKINGQETTLLVEFFAAPYEVKVAAETKPVTTVTKPTTKPVTKPTTKPTTTPIPVFYKAELSNQSAKNLGIKAQEQVKFWVEFKNTGTATWTNTSEHFVALNVTNPTGRQSAFQDQSWIQYYRPTILQQASVKPGAVGRFEFILKAPQKIGNYEEDFGLVAENLGWISGGTIELPIVVAGPIEKTTEQTVEVLPSATTTPSNTNLNVNQETTAPTEKEVAKPTTIKTTAENGLIGQIVEFAQKFYSALLIFVVIALLLNILIKIRIQHPHIIIQTVLVIILISAAILIKPHFLERIPEVLKII